MATVHAAAAGQPVQVDGSQLEGGGQLLRNASALAAITRQAIAIDNIRAGRSRPGLRPQHLAGLQLIARLSGGELEGGAVNSQSVTLRPRRLRCGAAVADTGTAGSCMLVAQAALPCLLFAQAEAGGGCGASSELELRGGTDATLAPPLGYLQHVLLPVLAARLGVRASAELVRRGFYPKGGGLVRLSAAALPAAACLPAVDITERGRLARVTIRAFTAGRVAPAVGERMARAAEAVVRAYLERSAEDGRAEVEAVVWHEPPERAVGDGCGVLLVAETDAGCLLGASGLGERGVTAEDVGARAAQELVATLAGGACVDEHLADQLCIFMALARGRSRVLTGEPTLHARTAVAVAEQLTGARFALSPAREGLWLLECEGAAGAAPVGGWAPPPQDMD